MKSSCDFELARHGAGVLIVAARAGPESEVPTWVGLGVEIDGAYQFVDAWIGPPSMIDFTPAGPAYALAPHDCGGRIAFFAEARLGGATNEAPDPALLAAEGEYVIRDGQVQVTPVERDGCQPISIELP